ncbi:ORF6N domain-containing protein [Agrobacterium tumefaciens]|nr:ORF6N domain-containing protein [Agrobacterium tumefaciens]
MQTVEIHGNALPVTAFNGVRVLTTERLAKVFGAPETAISQNYLNNAERFELGKHFFKVEGDELRALKNRLDFIGSVGKNAKALMLWTDRGASRHAKILDTDMAWDVYGELEEAYFANRADRRPMTMAEMALQNAQALVDMERRQIEQDAKLDAVVSDIAEIKQAHTVLERMPTDCEGIERIRKRMNKEYSLSVPVVDKIMRDSPYAPTVRVLVRNQHAEGAHNSGFAIKEVSAIFKRFASECRHSAGALHTHPYIEGRFKLVLPKRE